MRSVALVLAPLACGGGGDPGPQIITPHKDLCAGAAPEHPGQPMSQLVSPLAQPVALQE
jgi:hypothetical protein